MKILFIHNYYMFRGGEDIMAELDIKMLQENGHEVITYTRHNSEIFRYKKIQKAKMLIVPTFSQKTYFDVKRIIKKEDPDIVHINNFFPLVSPSAIYAASSLNKPVVLMLHDWRLICPIGLLFRNGRVCEECVEKTPLMGVVHRCYHGSAVMTLPISLMIIAHRLLKTWRNRVSAFVAVSEFVRKKYAEAEKGIPQDRIFVRQNYLEYDPGAGTNKREFAIFVGRISREKGVFELARAWGELKITGKPTLKIIGDGPEFERLKREIESSGGKGEIQLLGYLDYDKMINLMKKAIFSIHPSLMHETFGRTIIESYATGTPVIASKMGGFEELVEDGKTGILFYPPTQNNIAKAIKEALSHREKLREWGINGRNLFLKKFTKDIAYRKLMEIYDQVLDEKGGGNKTRRKK